MAGRGRGRQGVHTARATASASVAREGCRRDRPRRRDWPGTSFEKLFPPACWGHSDRSRGAVSTTNVRPRRSAQVAQNAVEDAAVLVIADLVRGVEANLCLELDRL